MKKQADFEEEMKQPNHFNNLDDINPILKNQYEQNTKINMDYIINQADYLESIPEEEWEIRLDASPNYRVMTHVKGTQYSTEIPFSKFIMILD